MGARLPDAVQDLEPGVVPELLHALGHGVHGLFWDWIGWDWEGWRCPSVWGTDSCDKGEAIILGCPQKKQNVQ